MLDFILLTRAGAALFSCSTSIDSTKNNRPADVEKLTDTPEEPEKVRKLPFGRGNAAIQWDSVSVTRQQNLPICLARQSPF